MRVFRFNSTHLFLIGILIVLLLGIGTVIRFLFGLVLFFILILLSLIIYFKIKTRKIKKKSDVIDIEAKVK